MGTEDEVRKHESECLDNYDLKGCTTCMHKKTCPSKVEGVLWNYKCDHGVEIPEGKMMINCSKYERKKNMDFVDDLFGGLFGGF
jgi:hypothetical protein